MVPPDVVDVDGDFEVGSINFGAEIVGGLEGGDGAAVTAVGGWRGSMRSSMPS